MSEIKKKLLKRKIMAMDKLPMIPEHVRKLMAMLKDPNSDIDKVMNLIERDLNLVAQILKIINSSLYCLSHRVESVSQAVSLIGFSEVWKLLMASSVLNLMEENEKTLWDHSYTTSVVVREFMRDERVNCTPDLPLITLLHDIGKLVFASASRPSFNVVKQICEKERVTSHKLEEKHLGVNHMEAGAWLLEAWALDDDYTHFISHHHNKLFKVPEALRKDIMIIQLADHCDHLARGMPYEHIEPADMQMVELGGINIDKWRLRQRDIVFEAKQMAM